MNRRRAGDGGSFLMPLNAGDKLGPYRIVRLIGSGAVGDVYAGQKEQEIVALKCCRSNAQTARVRFSREATALQHLHHPGFVRLIDADLEASPPWYAMEYLGPVSLRRLLDHYQGGQQDALAIPALLQQLHAQDRDPPDLTGPRQALPQHVAIRWTIDIAQALAHAHGRGLIHRDLKPENIMLREDGSPVVVDIGLVLDRQEQRLTGTGLRLGTHAYRAPEEKNVDERCDIFALGQILREMLTGQLAVHTPEEASLEAPLRLIIDRATAENPHRRYPSMLALAEDCHRYQQGARLIARRDPWWYRLSRRIMQWPRLTLLALLSGLLLLGVLATQYQIGNRQRFFLQDAQSLLDADRRVLSYSGSWKQSSHGWQISGPGFIESRRAYPGQLDMQAAFVWRPEEAVTEEGFGPRISLGLPASEGAENQEMNRGLSLGFRDPKTLVLWWQGHPWWVASLPDKDAGEGLFLRLRLDEDRVLFSASGVSQIVLPLPAPLVSGRLRFDAGTVGQTELQQWHVRLPSLPDLLPASSLVQVLLAETVVADEETFARWFTESQEALRELAASPSTRQEHIDTWQAFLYREALRRARQRSDVIGMAEARRALSLGLSRWQLRDEDAFAVAAALGNQGLMQSLIEASTAGQDQRFWLLRLRCPQEWQLTASLRRQQASFFDPADPLYQIFNASFDEIPLLVHPVHGR